MSARRSHRRFWWWLIGLWLAALAIRLVYLWEVSDSPLWLVVMGDARSYDTWARSLATGDWIGSDVFYQAPLYPYGLGVVYATLGDGPWAIRTVQSLLGATACVLLAFAGARLASHRAGLLAGAMLACYPPAIFFDGIIQKTSLTSLLMCGQLAVAASLARRPQSIAGWLTLGVLMGLLALVRENALVFVVLIPVWMAVAFRTSRVVWRFGWLAAVAVGMAIVLIPVAARNRYVGGEWHLTTSQFGSNFYIGNHAGASGHYEPLIYDRGDPLYERTDATRLAVEAVGQPLSPREVSQYWTQKTLDDIYTDPYTWLLLLIKKLHLTYAAHEIIDTEDQYTYAEYSYLLTTFMKGWHMGVLAPLAAFGLVIILLSPARRRRFAWPLLVIAGYTASLLLFFLFGRYRFPLVPPMVLLAAIGLCEAYRLARRAAIRRSRGNANRAVRVGAGSTVYPRRAMGIATALAAAALVAWPVNRVTGSVDVDKAITRSNLGKHFYLAQFPVDRIVSEYDRAVALAPDNLTIRSNYAQVLWALGLPDAARAQLEDGVRRVPQDAALRVELGLMLRDLGELGQATVQMRKATEAAPTLPEPPYHLATTLLRHANVLTAEALDESLEATDPESFEARQADALRRSAAIMRSEAVELLRESLAIDSHSDAAHAALGDALASLGHRAQASREYAIAASLAPPGSQRRAALQRRLFHLAPSATRNPEPESPARPGSRRSKASAKKTR